VLVGNLRTMKVVYSVNVSESSGTSLPRLAKIKGHETVMCVCVDVYRPVKKKLTRCRDYCIFLVYRVPAAKVKK